MLHPAEKAYYQALVALHGKAYELALGQFEQAAGYFEHDRDFAVLYETTRLVVEVRRQLAGVSSTKEEIELIEEVL